MMDMPHTRVSVNLLVQQAFLVMWEGKEGKSFDVTTGHTPIMPSRCALIEFFSGHGGRGLIEGGGWLY